MKGDMGGFHRKFEECLGIGGFESRNGGGEEGEGSEVYSVVSRRGSHELGEMQQAGEDVKDHRHDKEEQEEDEILEFAEDAPSPPSSGANPLPAPHPNDHPQVPLPLPRVPLIPSPSPSPPSFPTVPDPTAPRHPPSPTFSERFPVSPEFYLPRRVDWTGPCCATFERREALKGWFVWEKFEAEDEARRREMEKVKEREREMETEGIANGLAQEVFGGAMGEKEMCVEVEREEVMVGGGKRKVPELFGKDDLEGIEE